MKYDVVIIGAGIIGSLCADMLAKYQLSICVLEKENDSGLLQTMSSSAIVHSGIDPKSGTLKAELNVKGSKMMEALCQELNVDYVKCGGYVCVDDSADLNKLQQMKARADERNVLAKIISGDELRQLQPHASQNIKYALSMPTTAIIYPIELTIAALERAIENGVDVKYEHCVSDIAKNADESFTIFTNKKQIKANRIINCAGINSDKIARHIDEQFPIELSARRGEYFVTANNKPVVTAVMYPLPTSAGKGVLAVPTTHRNVLLGPTSNQQKDRYDDATHASDLNYIRDNITKVIDQMPNDIIKTYTGIRSSGNDGDFHIELAQDLRVINCVAIDSPGIASSPAIAQRVCTLLASQIKLEARKDYKQARKPYVSLKHLDEAQTMQLIATNPEYGKIVCRCERVSEGEIRAAIRKQNGARDLTGIKFRIRPMLGMCQGGFCEAQVASILADELNIPLSSVTRRGSQTLIVKGGADE